LPRLAAIEATLTQTAKNNQDISDNVKDFGKAIGEKIDQLTTNMVELTSIVKEHHKSLHLKDLMKSITAWLGAFIIFFVFHALSNSLELHGVEWLDLVLKFLGVK
jgi:hypothetical protein